MADGKCAPEGKSEPSCKSTSIDTEMKIRVICKYESGRSLSAIPLELGFTISTVNTIVKDATHVKEHMNGTTVMKEI
jgi:transposase-like protein